jgi:hypothetical protein
MIKVFPEPILREIAKEVEIFGSTELIKLIDHMFSVMSEKNGVGLAAPQIGISQRIFVYGFDKNPRYPDQSPVPRDYAINPEIVWKSTDWNSLLSCSTLFHTSCRKLWLLRFIAAPTTNSNLSLNSFEFVCRSTHYSPSSFNINRGI